MTTAGKATVGGGTFAVGGSATGVAIKKVMDMEPDAALLVTADNFDTVYTSGLLSSSDNNKNIFVDPDKSQNWWDWIYGLRFKTPSAEEAYSSEFKKVKLGFSTSDETALNRICRKALVFKKNELVVIPYKKDIWRYCSKSGDVPDDIESRPKTTSATNDDTSKFSGHTSNKDKFVGDGVDNEEWWNWIYENVFKLDKNGDSSSSLHTNFNSVTKGYATSGSNALNQVCKVAYEKKHAEIVDIKYKKNIWKYCSKEGIIPEGIDNKPSATTVSGSSDQFNGKDSSKDKFVDSSNTNEEWWNWIYENKFKQDKDSNSSDLHETFNAVTKGFDSNSSTEALNQVCKTAYEKRYVEVVNTKYKKNIWTYCSKDGTVPAGIADKPVPKMITTSDTNKFSGIVGNVGKFVDSGSDSEEWWNWNYEYVFKVVENSSLNDSFKSITKGYSSSESTDALNQVCKTAYDKRPAQVTNIKYKTDIWKYCSKDGQTPQDINNPPTYITLDDTKATSVQVSEKTKLGGVEKNKPLLIADISDNEEGWNWLFENKLSADQNDDTKKNGIHSEFKSITKGYSSSDSTDALNKVCKTATQKVKTDFENGNSDYKKSVEIYCTKCNNEGSLDLPDPIPPPPPPEPPGDTK